jgi:hypothetical protein
MLLFGFWRAARFFCASSVVGGGRSWEWVLVSHKIYDWNHESTVGNGTKFMVHSGPNCECSKSIMNIFFPSMTSLFSRGITPKKRLNFCYI